MRAAPKRRRSGSRSPESTAIEVIFRMGVIGDYLQYEQAAHRAIVAVDQGVLEDPQDGPRVHAELDELIVGPRPTLAHETSVDATGLSQEHPRPAVAVSGSAHGAAGSPPAGDRRLSLGPPPMDRVARGSWRERTQAREHQSSTPGEFLVGASRHRSVDDRSGGLQCRAVASRRRQYRWIEGGRWNLDGFPGHRSRPALRLRPSGARAMEVADGFCRGGGVRSDAVSAALVGGRAPPRVVARASALFGGGVASPVRFVEFLGSSLVASRLDQGAGSSCGGGDAGRRGRRWAGWQYSAGAGASLRGSARSGRRSGRRRAVGEVLLAGRDPSVGLS